MENKSKRMLFRDIFRPIRSVFRLAYSGGADDTRVIKLDPNEVPLHAEKPFSDGEVAGLRDSHKKDDRWGHETINIDNY